MSLSALKSLNMDRVIELEEAVALSAEARCIQNEFSELGLDEPEWLGKASNALREEIARRTRAAKLNRLKEVEATIDGLKSAGEKRREAESELAKLQKELGLAPAGKK